MRLLFEYLMNGRTIEQFIEAFDGVPRNKVLGVLEMAERQSAAGANGGVTCAARR